ncbi:MAG: tetratricopeptide repeat protein, partial [Microscillaceae bacterium]|nr:tetratricopeptide repeat protein [Microscillaceae bacterium]
MNTSLPLLFFFGTFLVFRPLCGQDLPTAPNQSDAQGKRQGAWVILYDQEWHIVDRDTGQVAFYRLINYREDQPQGRVFDKYRNGQTQMETTLRADRPKEIMHGETIFFRPDGSREKMQLFEEGTLLDEFEYDEKGLLIAQDWTLLDSLGNKARKARDYKQAYALYNRALLKARREKHPQHLSEALANRSMGNLFEEVGQYAQALGFYQTGIDLLRPHREMHPKDYAKLLNNQGLTYYNLAQLPKAEENWSEILLIYEKLYGKEHLDYVGTLSNLGVLCLDRGQYLQAEKYFKEALPIREKLAGKDHVDYAATMTHLGNLYRPWGQYAEAEACYQKAIEILRAKKDRFYAFSLLNLATLYTQLEQYDKAKPLLQEALDSARVVYGPQHPNYSRFLGGWRDFYRVTYQWEESKRLAQEVAQLRKQSLGEQHPSYAEALSDLALILEEQGQFSKAEALLEEALNIVRRSQGEKSYMYLKLSAKLAANYIKTGLYALAEPLLLEVLANLKNTQGTHNQDYAGYLSNLGVMYYDAGNFEKAEKCYREALAIRKDLFGVNSMDYSASLETLGNLFYSRQAYAQALELFQTATEIIKKIIGEDNLEYARAIGGLAKIYGKLGEEEKAEFYHLLGLQKTYQNTTEKNRTFIVNMLNAGVFYQNQGQTEKARIYLDSCARLSEQYLGPYHEVTQRAFSNLSWMSTSNQEMEKGQLYLQKAKESLFHQLARNYPAMSQKEKEYFNAKVLQGFLQVYTFFVRESREILPENQANLYDFLLATKGTLFNTQKKIQTAVLASGDSILIDQYENWQVQRNRLAQLYQLSPEERLQRNLDLAAEEEQINLLEKNISQAVFEKLGGLDLGFGN